MCIFIWANLGNNQFMENVSSKTEKTRQVVMQQIQVLAGKLKIKMINQSKAVIL